MSGHHPLDAGGLLLALQSAQRNAAWGLLHVRAGRIQFAEATLIEAQRALHHAEQFVLRADAEDDEDGEPRNTKKKKGRAEAAAKDGVTSEILSTTPAAR